MPQKLNILTYFATPGGLELSARVNVRICNSHLSKGCRAGRTRCLGVA
jgi:hypothetical protein